MIDRSVMDELCADLQHADLDGTDLLLSKHDVSMHTLLSDLVGFYLEFRVYERMTDQIVHAVDEETLNNIKISDIKDSLIKTNDH